MSGKKQSVIFMTTYNGAKYLSDQINSVINQSFGDWVLFISDDGSSDGTIEILRDFESLDPRIKVIQNRGPHGAYINYYNLFEFYKDNYGSCADYYFFCDQDDYWHPDKMRTEIDVLSRMERQYGKRCPLLCYTDLELMDATGNSLGSFMSDYSDIDLQSHPLDLFFSHCFVWGTTAAINKALWEAAKLPVNNRNDLSHDNWYAKHAVLLGHVECIPKPLVRYRRHDSNVTGLPRKYGLLKAIRRAMAFGDVIDAQSHMFWSSFEVLNSIDSLDWRGEELKKTFERGGYYAVRFMWKNKICPGSRFHQLARYINLGLCLHKRTHWFLTDCEEPINAK